MKRFTYIISAGGLIVLALLAGSLGSVEPTEYTRAFLDGLKSYEDGNYPAAIAKFSKIANAGMNNGKLFYNLGSSYLKNGDLGQAILWYERALRIIPGDPDLNFNLDYARTLIKDEKQDGSAPILRVLFFWKHIFGMTSVQWIAIILNLTFWLALTLQAVTRKKAFRISSYVVLAVAIVFTLTAFYNYYEEGYKKQGIVLPTQISVRSGLTDDSTELFILHAGTKVTIQKEKDDFLRIYFSEGKIGWVKNSEIAVI